MLRAMNRFVEAHDRYLALDLVRTECRKPKERELLYIEIMKAYLEVQFRANQFAGIQFTDGCDYMYCN